MWIVKAKGREERIVACGYESVGVDIKVGEADRCVGEKWISGYVCGYKVDTCVREVYLDESI